MPFPLNEKQVNKAHVNFKIKAYTSGSYYVVSDLMQFTLTEYSDLRCLLLYSEPSIGILPIEINILPSKHSRIS